MLIRADQALETIVGIARQALRSVDFEHEHVGLRAAAAVINLRCSGGAQIAGAGIASDIGVGRSRPPRWPTRRNSHCRPSSCCRRVKVMDVTIGLEYNTKQVACELADQIRG